MSNQDLYVVPIKDIAFVRSSLLAVFPFHLVYFFTSLKKDTKRFLINENLFQIMYHANLWWEGQHQAAKNWQYFCVGSLGKNRKNCLIILSKNIKLLPTTSHKKYRVAGNGGCFRLLQNEGILACGKHQGPRKNGRRSQVVVNSRVVNQRVYCMA